MAKKGFGGTHLPSELEKRFSRAHTAHFAPKKLGKRGQETPHPKKLGFRHMKAILNTHPI